MVVADRSDPAGTMGRHVERSAAKRNPLEACWWMWPASYGNTLRLRFAPLSMTLRKEYLEMLRRAGVEYDERYLWD
jgi:hypothetical protein